MPKYSTTAVQSALSSLTGDEFENQVIAKIKEVQEVSLGFRALVDRIVEISRSGDYDEKDLQIIRTTRDKLLKKWDDILTEGDNAIAHLFSKVSEPSAVTIESRKKCEEVYKKCFNTLKESSVAENNDITFGIEKLTEFLKTVNAPNHESPTSIRSATPDSDKSNSATPPSSPESDSKTDQAKKPGQPGTGCCTIM